MFWRSESVENVNNLENLLIFSVAESRVKCFEIRCIQGFPRKCVESNAWFVIHYSRWMELVAEWGNLISTRVRNQDGCAFIIAFPFDVIEPRENVWIDCFSNKKFFCNRFFLLIAQSGRRRGLDRAGAEQHHSTNWKTNREIIISYGKAASLVDLSVSLWSVTNSSIKSLRAVFGSFEGFQGEIRLFK